MRCIIAIVVLGLACPCTAIVNQGFGGGLGGVVGVPPFGGFPTNPGVQYLPVPYPYAVSDNDPSSDFPLFVGGNTGGSGDSGLGALAMILPLIIILPLLTSLINRNFTG